VALERVVSAAPTFGEKSRGIKRFVKVSDLYDPRFSKDGFVCITVRLV
jgi:hypothetical protein